VDVVVIPIPREVLVGLAIVPLGRQNLPPPNLFVGAGEPLTAIKFFSSIDECVYWYNTIKPHGALDLKTPIDAYYEKMPQTDILADPSIIKKEVSS